MTLDEIYNEIKKLDTFAILTHEAPDGDAIGSSCAFAVMLKNMGKSVVDVYLKEYPDIYKFVPGIDMIKNTVEKTDYDMVIVLDCPNITRVASSYRDIYEKAEVKVQFDHHHNNSMFADYNIVNPVSPACSQILASSFDYLKIETTKEIATGILTGIVTDTYGFRSSETTAESFEFAAWALTKGVNVAKVYKQSLATISKSRFEIENLATERLEFLEEGKIAFTYTNLEDEKRIGTKTGDLNSIVEIGRMIEGVEISIFVYEKENGCYKVSFRSNEYVDCSVIAFAFGGGGHLRNAGAKLNMSFEEVKKLVLEEAKKQLK